MRKITRQRLSESWIEQATKQKVDQKLERDIEKLRSMWQLRLKWKSNPTFSTWLEVQDPIHRHSWNPVDFHRTNLFDHYDFSQKIPDPLTRERAETDPSYMVPRAETIRENDFFCRKFQTTPMKTRSASPTMNVQQLIQKQMLQRQPLPQTTVALRNQLNQKR